MNQIKEHLDKIVAAAVILGCLGLIAKTHLSTQDRVVSIEDIDDAFRKLERAEKRKVEVSPTPDYGADFKESMARLDENVPDGLASWKLHPLPEGPDKPPPPPRDYTLVVKVFGETERAAADALVQKIAGAGVEGAFVYTVTGGFWVCVGKFAGPEDPGVKTAKERLAAGGFPVPTLRRLRDLPPPPPTEGVLALPAMEVKGVYLGRAELAALFNSLDRNWSVKLLQVWRRKAAEKKWPTAPLFTLRVEGGRATVTPGNGATGNENGLAITEIKLPPREAYEYRARAAASFPEKVKLAKDLDVTPAPKELAVLLKGPGYVTRFTAPVKIETPGEVQIQFSGELLLGRKRFGNFRFKKWLAGQAKPETHMMRFLLGKRIKAAAVKRIGGRPVKVVFDSEAILISIAPETREVWGWKIIMVKDPETGVLVPKKVRYRLPDKKVKVAVIKDTRTGKTHKLDQSGGNKGWWPKGIAVQAAPLPGTTPKTGPVTTPKTPVAHPPKSTPVTPKKPPVTGKAPPPPPPGKGPDAKGPSDPGPMPTTGDAKTLEEWEKKRKEYKEYLEQKRRAEAK